MVQCQACNLWGHFARDRTTANAPKLLCRWCSLGHHEDVKCLKSRVNLITIGTDEEEVLAITQKQAKLHPNPTKEKKRLEEARTEIEKATQAKKAHLKDTTDTSARNCTKHIIRQILQTEVPVKINDLLLTMPQLRSALTNITPAVKLPGEHGREKESGASIVDRREKENRASTTDTTLLALSSERHPTVIEIGILGTVLTNTIVDSR